MRPVRLLRIGRNSGPCSSSPWPAASSTLGLFVMLFQDVVFG
jgi:hypothetical protein